MIGIFAENDRIISIEEVIDWLDHYKKDWERIVGLDFFTNHKTLSIKSLNSKDHGLNKYSSIWYRGFLRDRVLSKKLLADLDSSNENIFELNKVISSEISVLRKLILNNHHVQLVVPNTKSIYNTKLDILALAEKKGLKIPDLLITNSKSELGGFLNEKNGKVITKPLYEISFFFDGGSWYRYLTSPVTQLNSMKETFFPSLFQEQIEKNYELRVFVLGEKVFPMAIFSQIDAQTKIDFRNYNDEKPNRTVPYKLPKKIESRLLKLFKALNLNTGSADFIRSLDGDYYFLEINPLGQFGMTSKPCNYYLEREIAQFLK